MKKTKSQKVDNVRLFASAYLSAVARNLEYIEQINQFKAESKQIKSTNSVIQTEPGRSEYHIKMKMFTDKEEQVWNFTDLIQLIQFESPALLVKLLRQIHHNYSVLNIQEQVKALNERKVFCGSYSESIPNELYILKTLADCIEAVKESDSYTTESPRS
jgi:hypothetical protein